MFPVRIPDAVAEACQWLTMTVGEDWEEEVMALARKKKGD